MSDRSLQRSMGHGRGTTQNAALQMRRDNTIDYYVLNGLTRTEVGREGGRKRKRGGLMGWMVHFKVGKEGERSGWMGWMVHI